MIILQVIQAPLDPPNPGDLNNQQWRGSKRSDRGGFDVCRVLFPIKRTTNPALPLLLTNRQIYHETLDTIQRAYKAPTSPPPSYKADVIYLRENGTLWPTWLSVPFRASHADTLHAQFRIFRSPPGLIIPSEPPPNFFHHEGVMYSLHHLLASALASGKYGPFGQPITVHRLVLDFLPASEAAILPVAPVVTWEWVSGPKEVSESVSATDIRPDISEGFPLDTALLGLCLQSPRMEAAARLMCYVLGMLKWLAKMTTDTWEYGKVLFEHVGIIEVRLDGKVYETLDLGICLANVQHWQRNLVGSRRYRVWHGEFVPWRREVEMRRRKLGLPVQA